MYQIFSTLCFKVKIGRPVDSKFHEDSSSTNTQSATDRYLTYCTLYVISCICAYTTGDKKEQCHIFFVNCRKPSWIDV